ncbi:MAG: NAD(P)-dependent oxidoreductase [Kutzneria sp.]|nr:NAD(P)-dependent oxidoreductase [Kutzneria sp.]MBV9847078.1 NAD(P)-dependent oxidoreductase [Kutzneria sp.]
MRVLLAGATGVIGRELLPLLRSNGHHVTVMVRDTCASPPADDVVVADIVDTAAVSSAVCMARPEVIVNQVTSLRPEPGDTRWEVAERNAQVLTEGAANLVAAARAAGVRRIVTQSMARVTAPIGGPLLDEDAPLYLDAPDALWETAVRAVSVAERIVLGQTTIEAVVLRYGLLYGANTQYDINGANGLAVRLGRLPLVGPGTGISSFLHVRDAAEAAALAVDATATGVFNVVDDDPVAANVWLPHYAAVMGGPQPKRVPLDLGVRLLGWVSAYQQTRLRGASNRKAREQLGWRPTISSWRGGRQNSLVGATR